MLPGPVRNMKITLIKSSWTLAKIKEGTAGHDAEGELLQRELFDCAHSHLTNSNPHRTALNLKTIYQTAQDKRVTLVDQYLAYLLRMEDAEDDVDATLMGIANKSQADEAEKLAGLVRGMKEASLETAAQGVEDPEWAALLARQAGQ